jgi:hypothetical protein
MHQSGLLIHRCYKAIIWLSQNHWHYEVRTRAEETIRMLTQVNPSEIHLEQKKKLGELKPPKGRRSWLKILSFVEWEGMDVTHEEMNEEVETLYGGKQQNRLNPKFMPCPRENGGKELYEGAMKRLTMKNWVEIEK